MTVSTYRVVPEASASGTAPHAEPNPTTLTWLARSPFIEDQALARAASPDYPRWLAHVRPAAGCTRPIRLSGTIETVVKTGDGADATYRWISTVDTATSMPDGVIYKPCGTRLASVCPSCSARYKADAFHLVLAGLSGGDGIPATVAEHPAVFSTLTAPSFGEVHTRVVKRHFCADRRRCVCRPEPCHARRDMPRCPHGRRMACFRRHAEIDRRLGTPLCPDCYDYPTHVMWNYLSGELWRRTRIGIERHLRRTAKSRGVDPATVKLAYGKAAEMQRRAAVHFHIVIRLDGRDPAHPEEILPPPEELDAEDLAEAVEHAARTTAFGTEPHPDQAEGWCIGWGAQVESKTIAMAGAGQISRAQVAAYVAKYATKATEDTGHTSRRLTGETIDVYADLDGNHTERLIATSWQLGRPVHTSTRLGDRPTRTDPTGDVGPQWTCPDCACRTVLPHCPDCRQPAPWLTPTEPAPEPTRRGPSTFRGLRRWAHRFGFGGHFFTKSHRYTATFTYKRQQRIAYRRNTAPATGPIDPDRPPSTQDTVLQVNFLEFVGAGWHTAGDALLANTSAALAREHQYAAQVEIAAMAA